MNKSAFLKLIQQVSGITDQQNEELEKVAAAFPYCQTAHLLLAKSAYDKGSMLSTQRLRRASSYATDRQLLKRVIYTSPIPVPELVQSGAEAEEEIIEETAFAASQDDFVTEAIPEFFPEESAEREEETLDEVYTPATPTADMIESPYTSGIATGDQEEENLPEGELDSELALLFTFSSISPSSTDLLSDKIQPEEQFEEPSNELPTNHFAETTEALTDIDKSNLLDEEYNEAIEVQAVEENFLPDDGSDSDTVVEIPVADETPADEVEEHDFYSEEDTEPVLANAEDAAINYVADEIDRLYAEDVLGYWMGSSRMGEVLQLKDDYTRPRPQSFHPELILEYSKTHELEKAIQPSSNILSHQIDIIDQFLKLNPRLKTMANLKLKPEPQEDLSLKSSKIKKGTASVSLAAIFHQQGKIKKAIKIYEQLILKYPEKKSYFAEQIEKLQNVT